MFSKGELVKAIAQQIINMLDNNVLNEYGGESFIGWLEDGEVFRLNGMVLEDVQEAMKIVEQIAPHLDMVSFILDENA